MSEKRSRLIISGALMIATTLGLIDGGLWWQATRDADEIKIRTRVTICIWPLKCDPADQAIQRPQAGAGRAARGPAAGL